MFRLCAALPQAMYIIAWRWRRFPLSQGKSGYMYWLWTLRKGVSCYKSSWRTLILCGVASASCCSSSQVSCSLAQPHIANFCIALPILWAVVILRRCSSRRRATSSTETTRPLHRRRWPHWESSSICCATSISAIGSSMRATDCGVSIYRGSRTEEAIRLCLPLA